jgi:hypothetical protein
MTLPPSRRDIFLNVLRPVLSISRRIGNKSMLITAVVIIATLIVDSALEKIADLLGAMSADAEQMSVTIFIVISAIAYGIGQYLVLSFVSHRNNQIINVTSRINRKKDRFVLTQRFVIISQFVLSAMLISVILLMASVSYYYTTQLIILTVISYAMSIFLLSLLSNRFFSWYRISSNHNWVVLSYGVASAVLTINLALGVAFMTLALLNQSPEVRPHIATSFTAFGSDSAMGMLYSSTVISGIASFLSMWVSTTLLLRHHSRKLGKVKFWMTVAVPLVYFLTPFIPSFFNQIAAPLLSSDPIFAGILFTLIFAISKPAGGILFGVAFWTVARAVRESSVVRDYMIMSALGVVVLFVSTQGSVIAARYPPFGLVTVSYVGLSAFMMVIGLYSSAISVSEDDKLRKTIRRNALEESKLLESIGTAQMGQEIESRVMQIEKKVMEMAKEDAEELEVETGVKPSLEEPDMKKYLEEVMLEVSASIKSKQPRNGS